MKILVFSDPYWSLGRVHRGVAKQLPQHEFRIVDWNKRENLVSDFKWCDRCVTNLHCSRFLRENYPMFDLKKCVFIAHGAGEHSADHSTYDSQLTYGMTSDSVRHLFPPHIQNVFLTPNGVDTDDFIYKERDGVIRKLGWCGDPKVPSKQIELARDISARTQIPLDIARDLSYDDVAKWYHSVDILLITAVPKPESETGPLPAFEAIVSGIPVIGTPVGNFRHIPGPKFSNIEDAVELMNLFIREPEHVKKLARLQYDYVMQNFAYNAIAHKWNDAFQFS
jgi:glycosyltransferase involved in cell wall biosynthesis